ncbi:MAG TPA: DUF1905 domain-containing protein [Candidatus Nanopelagicales bacterium]|nr:DUF1905 domain-containing protein [Candidatus Nanopelagicales bacterium]
MPLESEFAAELWRWPAKDAWYFVTLPLDLADDIRSRAEPAGFGSVKVHAEIGSTRWSTSVFPDTSSGSYVLPVKAAVRRAEALDEGSEAMVRLRIELEG